MTISRRELLVKGLIGLGAGIPLSKSWAQVGENQYLNFDDADIVIKLTSTQMTLDVGVGNESLYWVYRGELIKGPDSSLDTTDQSYLGPTINVRTGDRVKIIFENKLRDESIVHWHGLDVSHENDGHPQNAVGTDESYEYNFVVDNRAGFYWYHPHPHGKTGLQVYQGLAGLFIVRDDEEGSLNLPEGDQEKSFVIQDRFFGDDNKLEYRPSMMGAFGNTLLINGSTVRKRQVKKGLYRVRLLNGCNARIFNVALSSGEKLQQIGSDGGLLADLTELERFYFAPAERIDLLIDFSKYSTGDVVNLESLPLVEGRGEKYTLLEFEVLDESSQKFDNPSKLSQFEVIPSNEAVNSKTPKVFELIPERGIGWTINGLGYEANRYEDYELIKFGSTEIWEFYNPTGMPHPMHIHGTQFQVLERASGQFSGCLDEGWKDTVLVMPGDRVKIIKRFNTYKGTFLYHCHNLEHEDMSMMRNFKIDD